MAQTVTIDSVDRTTKVPRESIEIAESLYLGEIGEGKLIVRDTVGNIAIKGWKPVAIDQDASTPARIGTGLTQVKTIAGRLDPMTAGRDIQIGIKDSNVYLSLLVAHEDDANRAAETVGERMTWVVAQIEALGLAFDLGRVEYPAGVGMDKNDCRGRKWGDVIADCAKAMRFNYGTRYNEAEDKTELVFRQDNTQTTDTADGWISNDPGDVDSDTVFAAMEDEPLTHTEDPEAVASGMYGAFAKGSVYRTRDETAAEFIDRDAVTEDSGDKTRATAERNADTQLYVSRDEERHLELKVRLRADQLGKFPVGFRTKVKQVHLAPEGWGDFRWAQILRRRLTQPLRTDFDYDCRLTVSPQEDDPPAAAIVQSAFGHTADGGGTLTLPNPVTIGSLLVFVISASHANNPAAPNTSPGVRWGPGAWTKSPSVTIKNGYGTGEGEGIAIWYKTADATDQTGYIGSAAAAIGIFELSGADIASAVTDYETDKTAANPMIVGTLGSPVAGSVNLLVGNWADSSFWNPGDPPPAEPTWTGTAYGWTLDHLYRIGAVYPRWGPPVSYIAHNLGDGSALTAGGTRSGLQWLPGQWCGACISIPPL